MKRKLLLTGAAGRIGSFFLKTYRDDYDFVLTDRRETAETQGYPFHRAELSDFDAVRALCEGVDTVIHLGADPSMEATWESLLPSNVIATYNVFEAARLAGCRRVIFASSVNAVWGYPTDVQVHTDMPLFPVNLYGVTKCWGEALGRYYSATHGLSSICLRFGAVQPQDSEMIDLEHPYIDIILTWDDCARLIAAAVNAPDSLDFGIYHGVSDNRFKRLDISDARRELGYAPQDDAFALAKARKT
ncbi:MAG: NAD(P)-dependent oxidoreductase [Chloroflexi bacterium]|nr:NAD(P)-dependent oxidoreductase [Chloroflexota bacterium]